MHRLYETITQALASWTRKYLCDEDPDERRARLREEALKEIDAELLPLVQLRLAMHACVSESETRPERELTAA